MTTEALTGDDVVARVTAARSALGAHLDWEDENRRLHPETIEALADAGVFRMRTPRRYGGLECPTRALIDVATEIGRANPAAAWVSGVYWIPTWMTSQLPDAVQDEVFATENVRVCGTLSPSAQAVPAEGGIVVDGRWGFISGAHDAHWQEIIAIFMSGEGEPYPVLALVPMSDLIQVDDWHTDALRGTGSITTIAESLFVPQERVIPLPAVLEGQGVSEANAGSKIYSNPLLPVASASSVGPVLGMATRAMEIFRDRLPDRKITYTAYTSQQEAPLTHVQVADARMRLDEAAFHAYRLADTVDAKGAEGTPWKLDERAQARGDLGAVVRRSKETGEILGNASGGTSIYREVPIQRVVRDLATVNLHALMHPDTNDELYGRVLCGLEPNTQYI